MKDVEFSGLSGMKTSNNNKTMMVLMFQGKEGEGHQPGDLEEDQIHQEI